MKRVADFFTRIPVKAIFPLLVRHPTKTQHPGPVKLYRIGVRVQVVRQ